MNLRLTVAIVIAAVAVAIITSNGMQTQTVAPCDRVASPGTDAALNLVNSLSAGQTGCLHAGTYTGPTTIDKPVTLTSYPGERATLAGRMWVTSTAPGTVVTNLNLDGRNASLLPSPTVNADNTVFQRNDVSNSHTSICFNIGGSPTYRRAHNTLIDQNVIHDCGSLPPGNHDQGIYVDNADYTTITNNWIYRNADRGIQLYPDADHTVIRGNVIDSNGEGIIFSGGVEYGSYTKSDDNTVTNNIITNSQVRQNLESSYGQALGTGNLATNNCVWGVKNSQYSGTPVGSGIGAQIGFTATDNIVANPLYVDPANGNYNLQPGSPCAAILNPAPPPPPVPSNLWTVHVPDFTVKATTKAGAIAAAS